MKVFLLAVSLFMAIPALATIKTVRIDSSSSNIPTSFSTATTSQKITSGIRVVDGIMIDNRTSTEVVVNCNGLLSAPSDSDQGNIYVAASSTWAIDSPHIGKVCYIRSGGSAISSGIVVITLKGA